MLNALSAFLQEKHKWGVMHGIGQLVPQLQFIKYELECGLPRLLEVGFKV